MKNVLIVSHSMEIGGAESALIGLLNAFDYSRFNVDLFLLRHGGEFFDFIPSEVNVLPEIKEYASLAVPLSEIIRNRTFGTALGRLRGKRRAEEYCRSHNIKDTSYVFIDYSHKYTCRHMPMISEKEYDLVISYLTPHYFAAAKTKGKKKIAWIHTDYSSIEADFDSELEMWSAYDNIVAISEKVREAFLKNFPSLESKIFIIENMHPAELIRARAREFTVEDEMPDDGYVKLLSVGRFSIAKNFDNLPDICRRMKNVKWYIIGYGTDGDLIRAKIEEAGVGDRVIILGKRMNPYPYFKACDIYVQPSRYEGNSVTVNEALILGKPVAIAAYPTAASQIDDGVNGIIFPQDNAGSAEAIERFINDPELRARITENVKNSDFSKSDEINKLYSLI
ncbi:MAG: glycosyltransferase [Clostridia bacterium]|nr:glycosyltransferase [Clostridia bacterium]